MFVLLVKNCLPELFGDLGRSVSCVCVINGRRMRIAGALIRREAVSMRQLM